MLIRSSLHLPNQMRYSALIRSNDHVGQVDHQRFEWTPGARVSSSSCNYKCNPVKIIHPAGQQQIQTWIYLHVQHLCYQSRGVQLMLLIYLVLFRANCFISVETKRKASESPQQQRESPQIPFPSSCCGGNTSLIKRVHGNAGTRSFKELYCIVPGSAINPGNIAIYWSNRKLYALKCVVLGYLQCTQKCIELCIQLLIYLS